MVRVTSNFQSEAPLDPRVSEALIASYADGWADRRKISQSSSKARNLFYQSRESMAYYLGVRAENLEFTGEPRLAFHLLFSGFLYDGKNLGYSAIDKKAILAVARNVRSTEISVDRSGQLGEIPAVDFLSLQLANGETGIIQRERQWRTRIICDATTSGPYLPLPDVVGAIFDSKSWGGPAGISAFAINDRAHWRNPLPHIEPVAAPHSYSLPLLIASAVALEYWIKEKSEYQKVRELTSYLRSSMSSALIPGDVENSLPHITALLFKGCRSESLQQRLASRGFDVDSGSLCVSDDVKPSHVLANMGFDPEGHIGITIHKETTRDDIDRLVNAINEVVAEERA